ncbi:MAG: hypothetical protein J0I23_27860, partial [Rhizobiales bacterium]|nr:hypothetical protein [Hyphomicrobiales bacterium]
MTLAPLLDAPLAIQIHVATVVPAALLGIWMLLARKGTLVSLCNLGPVLHPRAVTMIHDAQVHLTPQSYSRGFRLWYKFLPPLVGRTNRQILTVSEYSKQQLVRYGVAPDHPR